MFHNEQHCREERERLERAIERLLDIVDDLLDRKMLAAQSATGELMSKTVLPGVKSLFTFTEWDGPNGTGNKVKASGPITFASDNTAVATVDNATQRLNADGVSIDVDVVSGMQAGIANITGVDSASPNKVAAGDVLTVSPVIQGVAVSATAKLS